MKKLITIIMLITILTITIAGCNSKSTLNEMQRNENSPIIEAGSKSNVDERDAISADEGDSEDSDRNMENDSNSAELLQGFESWQESDAIIALNKVLNFQETITDATQSDTNISELTCKKYYLNKIDTFLEYKFDTVLIPDRYAVADIDQDDTPEVVVCLSGGGEEWIGVLRYYEGTVYGYSFVLRGFEKLKIDGTYMASSGALNNEILRLGFDGIKANEICLGSATVSNDEVAFYIGGQKVLEQEYRAFINKFYDKKDAEWHLFQSNIRAGYERQKLLRVNFTAKTHAHVRDITEYHSGMEEKVQFTYSSQIPAELCDIILDAMEQGTEKETFAPLMIDTQINQEEFVIKTGVILNNMESIQPARADADNDGFEDLIGLHYWGGTGGFGSMEFYKGSADGKYTLVSTFDCLTQKFRFLQYNGKQYLLMEEFDYNTKYYNGYSLYLYENGMLADGKTFSFVIDEYAMNIVHEDKSFEEIVTVKKTLCNTKMPDILKNSGGVINGTAETLHSDGVSFYGYSCDLDNDGNGECYNKSMWYPSNMGTVMMCVYQFEDSMTLDDLCSRLSDEIGDGRLYTFWLDEVNGKNLLYLYFGNNLDFSLYAFLISNAGIQ